MKSPLVAIVLGSDSDLPLIKSGIESLKTFNLPYEVRILSAHRCPDEVRKFARSASKRGIKAIIACAGMAAHLPGVIASFTIVPVIGVPLPSKVLKGVDSLASILQMPAGIPVATMSIGEPGVRNGILLALEIIALDNERVRKQLIRHKDNLRKKVLEKDEKIAAMFS
ncbi:MAG TPA: 5-(carboxyamino)imidazole ribonucleotide mutase [Candidatus Omnitrophica bacterium]|nr:5-(carboxyamino)imidazole ribonucleotide mutase [Candidatus Omnitrophota bacterium]